jgi:hypothetical protein
LTCAMLRCRKTVLIVGASVSASEIARDISPFVHRIIASVRVSFYSQSQCRNAPDHILSPLQNPLG